MVEAAAPAPVLAVNGFLQSPSGAGIIHERLGDVLGGLRHPIIRFGGAADLHEAVPAAWRRLVSTPPPADVLIWTSSPLPLRVSARTALFPLVYDLRWRRTRGPAGRLYRGLDLARQLRRATAVLTISEAVAAELSPLSGIPVHVLPLGPGQFEGFAHRPPVNTRRIVLIGNAPHKRNEEAARLLVSSARVRRDYEVTGIRVSAGCRAILEAGMPPGSVKTFGIVRREELAHRLDGASVYLSLSEDEGYGFPYVEASYFGCDVIAPDGPVTREVLGAGSPTLLDGARDGRALERALDAWDGGRIAERQRRAVRSSWEACGRAVLDAVARHV